MIQSDNTSSVKVSAQGEPLEARLAKTFDDLLGDDVSADETAEEIIQAIRTWRALPPSRSLE